MNGPALMRALTDKKALSAGTFTKTLTMIFHAYSPDSKIVTSPKLNTAHFVISQKRSKDYSPRPAIFNKKPAIASNFKPFSPIFESFFVVFMKITGDFNTLFGSSGKGKVWLYRFRAAIIPFLTFFFDYSYRHLV
jgi:hypothetical protein